MAIFANTDFTEVFAPKPKGEPINSHVVPAVLEPQPDYDAMQRLIESKGDDPNAPKENVKKAA